MSKAIARGMSEQEARAMLRKRGILAFQAMAGMIPQKTDLIDNLPTFTALWNYQSEYWHRSWHGDTRGLKISRLSLKCDEPMCFDCADALELYIQPKREVIQIEFVPHWDNETCVFCGNECRDGIPF